MRGDPCIQILEARTGATAICVGERQECSLEDPEDEARRLAREMLATAEGAGASGLVVFGIGVHALRFLSDWSGSLLVVEPSLALCRAVLSSVDLSDVLPRIELLVTDDAPVALAHPLWTDPSAGVFTAHPTARRRDSRLYEQLARCFHPGGQPGARGPRAPQGARAANQHGGLVGPHEMSAESRLMLEMVQRIAMSLDRIDQRLHQLSLSQGAAGLTLVPDAEPIEISLSGSGFMAPLRTNVPDSAWSRSWSTCGTRACR